MSLLKKVFMIITLFYNRFQSLVLAVFVIGVIDLLLYSDIVMTLFLIPEFTPLVLMVLFSFGIYRFLKSRWKRAESSKNKGS